jgi:hypothetical protein
MGEELTANRILAWDPKAEIGSGMMEGHRHERERFQKHGRF